MESAPFPTISRSSRDASPTVAKTIRTAASDTRYGRTPYRHRRTRGTIPRQGLVCPKSIADAQFLIPFHARYGGQDAWKDEIAYAAEGYA
jgi:hypothetical protein